MEKVLKVVAAITLIVAGIFAFAICMAYPTKWMVNYLFAPASIEHVFGVTHITMWQAFVLNILAGFLFKSSNNGK